MNSQTITRTQELQELQSKRTKCEVWTRVMGYHRPVSQFNCAKRSEYFSREVFEEKASSIPGLNSTSL